MSVSGYMTRYFHQDFTVLKKQNKLKFIMKKKVAPIPNVHCYPALSPNFVGFAIFIFVNKYVAIRFKSIFKDNQLVFFYKLIKLALLKANSIFLFSTYLTLSFIFSTILFPLLSF